MLPVTPAKTVTKHKPGSKLYDFASQETHRHITEFGTVKDPDQCTALYEYSPYHRVVDGTRYPAVLWTTGENDHRVSPTNSGKMAARLQAANASGEAELLRTTFDVGHGIGTALEEQILEHADVFGFLFNKLDVIYRTSS